jgi:hypothetical protein
MPETISRTASQFPSRSSFIPSRNLRNDTQLRDWFLGHVYPPGRIALQQSW